MEIRHCEPHVMLKRRFDRGPTPAHWLERAHAPRADLVGSADGKLAGEVFKKPQVEKAKKAYTDLTRLHEENNLGG